MNKEQQEIIEKVTDELIEIIGQDPFNCELDQDALMGIILMLPEERLEGLSQSARGYIEDYKKSVIVGVSPPRLYFKKKSGSKRFRLTPNNLMKDVLHLYFDLNIKDATSMKAFLESKYNKKFSKSEIALFIGYLRNIEKFLKKRMML